MVGNHTALVSITNNYSRDFQAAEVEEYTPTSQQATSHPRPQLPMHPTRALLPASPSLTFTANLQQVLSDGMDMSLSISSDVDPSPVTSASPASQSVLRYNSTAESPPLSTRVVFRTPSKVLLASQHPEKWTGATTRAGSLLLGTPPNRSDRFCGQRIFTFNTDTQLCLEGAETHLKDDE